MAYSFSNKDNTDIIRVDDGKPSPGEDPLVIVQYETKRTAALNDVVTQQLIGVHVFTVFTVSFPIAIGLHTALLQHLGENHPAVDEEFLRSSAMGISVSDDRSTATITFMRSTAPDDFDPHGTFKPKIMYKLLDGGLVVNIYLTRKAAWGICTLMANDAFRNITVEILDAMEEARTTTPQ